MRRFTQIARIKFSACLEFKFCLAPVIFKSAAAPPFKFWARSFLAFGPASRRTAPPAAYAIASLVSCLGDICAAARVRASFLVFAG